jgi:hypothetical protein
LLALDHDILRLSSWAQLVPHKIVQFLYGDDVTKNVQEIQNVNKFGRKISSDDQYGRGSGFGMRDRGVEVAIKV